MPKCVLQFQELTETDHLFSTYFGKHAGDDKQPACPHRRLVVAVDRTYLQAGTRMCTTSKGCILTGGPHRPHGFKDADESSFVLDRSQGDQQFSMKGKARASEMESFTVWDPTRKKSIVLEAACYPCLPSASIDGRFEEGFLHPKNNRGKWETLHRIGHFLESCPCIKILIADGHKAHGWMHRFLLGQNVPLSPELRDLLPFWGKTTVEDLPLVCFSLGYRVLKYNNEAILYVPGICHLQKNFCEQGRSALRTMMFGRKSADSSACLQTGMFPAAFVGHDTMSDYQAALWFLI